MTQREKETNREVGFVTEVNGYLLRLDGLPSAQINDLLIDGSEHHRALVTALESTFVEATLLDNSSCLPGDKFFFYSSGFVFPCGESLLGRVVSPLGKPLDSSGSLSTKTISFPLDVVAPGISTREIVNRQLFTGVIAVDLLLPLGRGQRELVFGDPHSRKTSFLVDVIANQNGNDVICIYTALGKARADVLRLWQSLVKSGSDRYTTFILASSAEPASLIAITPKIAFAVAEYFRAQGRDVVLILDDLGTHARSLREIALLAGRMPGRESYPGDIFHQHAELMERAGNFNKEFGGGSITLLPVIEAEISSFSDYIPTNLMSATDGHLLFDSETLAETGYPPINVARSVTRVGAQTQKPVQRELSYRLRATLADYKDLERFTHFETELSPETQMRFRRGSIAQALLRQDWLVRLDLPSQIFLLSLVFTTFFDGQDREFALRNRDNLVTAFKKKSEFQDFGKGIETSSLDEVLKLLEGQLADLKSLCR